MLKRMKAMTTTAMTTYTTVLNTEPKDGPRLFSIAKTSGADPSTFAEDAR